LLAVGDELEADELAAAALPLAAAADRARAAVVAAEAAPDALAPALGGGAVGIVRRGLFPARGSAGAGRRRLRSLGGPRRARPAAAARRAAAPQTHPRDPLSGRQAAAGRRARWDRSGRPCRRPSATGGHRGGRRGGRPPPARAHDPAPRGRPCA